jgi:glucose dehydrogenase
MRRYVQEVQVMAVSQDPKGNDSRRYLPRPLYRYRYLVLGVVLAAIVGQITFGYATATSQIDLSDGGVADWPQYGRDQAGSRYTPLDQVNRDIVAYLRKAWEYHTGDLSDGSDGLPETTFQATPILVDGVLYLATVYGRVIALNPQNGAELWSYDPKIDATVERGEYANRGVTYWRAADPVRGGLVRGGSLSPPWTRG